MDARSTYILGATLAAAFALNGTLPARPAAARDASQNEHVSASLIADVDAVVPGRVFTIGVRLVMDEGWHVNWINPGDLGLAPAIDWSIPEGFVAAMEEWPHPWHYRTATMVIFGYGGEVVILREVAAPDSVTPGTTVRLGADVSWVACGEATLRGEAALGLRLPVGSKPGVSASTEAIEAAKRSIPVRTAEWDIEGWYQDDYTIVLQMQSSAAVASPVDVFFFPYETGIIENGAAQKVSVTGDAGITEGACRLAIERSRTVHTKPDRLSGVLVSTAGWAAGGKTPAIAVDIPLLESPR